MLAATSLGQIKAFRNVSKLQLSFSAATFKPKPGPGPENDQPQASKVTWPSAQRSAEAENKMRGSPRNAPVGAVNAAEEALGIGPEVTADDSPSEAIKKVAGRVIGRVLGNKALDPQVKSNWPD